MMSLNTEKGDKARDQTKVAAPSFYYALLLLFDLGNIFPEESDTFHFT